MSDQNKRQTLSECSSMELAQLLMRDLWRIYDAGGHSCRSARSLLLETAMQLRESITYGWAPEYSLKDMAQEIKSRENLVVSESIIPILPITEYSNKEFICLCIEGAYYLHLALDEQSMVEEVYFTLIRKFLNSTRRVNLCILIIYEIDAFIQEGRRRSFQDTELKNWHP